MDEFSQDFLVMKVLMFEPRLCTLDELQTIYSLSDFYNFVEMIDVSTALKKELEKDNK